MHLGEEPRFVATVGWAPPSKAPVTAFAPPVDASVTSFAPAAEAPTAVLAPPAQELPRPPVGPRRRRTRRRVMSRVLLVAVVAACAVYAAGAGGQLIGLLREGASARAVPVEGGSLLRAVALQAALKGLPDDGRVESLRVAADRIDARVVVDGGVRFVRVTRRGWVTDLPARQSPSGPSVRIDPRAPARMVRAVTRRTGRSAASVSHLTLDGTRWQLLFSDGAQFSANVRGRAVRRG